MILGNIVINTFIQGGLIMWPLLITSFVALTVVAERSLWWFRIRSRRNPGVLNEVYEALETANVKRASNLSRSTQDPVLQVIWHGLNHHHTSLQNALQVAAAAQIEKAGRFLSVLDTIITLAPLLGLLGTILGIMHSFNFVGAEAEVAAVKVSGGIAEALIATGVGLGIAIFTLLPYNFFHSRLAKLTFEIQTAATNVEVLLKAAKEGAHLNSMENANERDFAPTA